MPNDESQSPGSSGAVEQPTGQAEGQAPAPQDGSNGEAAGDGTQQEAKPEEGKEPVKAEVSDEPPTRKLAHILARKDRQIERAKSASPAPAPEAAPTAVPDDIDARIDERFKPLIEAAQQTEDAKEVDAFLSAPGNEVLKQFRDKILKHASHESRRHIPIADLAYAIAGPELMKLGAKQAREAEHAANQSRTGGNPAPQGEAGQLPEAWNLSPAEFAKVRDTIRR
ncbi:MAG: hypothetical protein WC052_05325 [Patescibacteria group bacterium]